MVGALWLWCVMVMSEVSCVLILIVWIALKERVRDDGIFFDVNSDIIGLWRQASVVCSITLTRHASGGVVPHVCMSPPINTESPSYYSSHALTHILSSASAKYCVCPGAHFTKKLMHAM